MSDEWTVKKGKEPKRAMTDVEIIFFQIENVSHDDTAQLSEIDARVWCWLSGKMYSYAGRGEDKVHKVRKDIKIRGLHMYLVEGRKEAFPVPAFKNYTRSRDALKAIRPVGYKTFQITYNVAGRYTCFAGRRFDMISLPTEELAELHAIIQAIEFERAQ